MDGGNLATQLGRVKIDDVKLEKGLKPGSIVVQLRLRTVDI